MFVNSILIYYFSCSSSKRVKVALRMNCRNKAANKHEFTNIDHKNCKGFVYGIKESCED